MCRVKLSMSKEKIIKISPHFNIVIGKRSRKPKPIAMQEALGLFDAFADRRDLAFNYLNDGCFFRSHLICKELSDMGLRPRKSWAFKKGSDGYLRPGSLGSICSYWNLHIAPVVDIKGVGKDIHSMIIDPVLFNGPVYLEEWLAVLGDKFAFAGIVDSNFAPNPENGYACNQMVSEETIKWHELQFFNVVRQSDYSKKRKVLESTQRKLWSSSNGLTLKESGETWVVQNSKSLRF